MPDVLDVARSFGIGTAISGAGLAAAAVSHLDPGTVVLIAGGVIWAIATWRRDKRQVILDSNKDLVVRNTQLQEEQDRSLKHTAELEAELKRRPELGSLETLIRTLTEKLIEHDGNTGALGKAILDGQRDLAGALDRNTQAVQFLATGQHAAG